MRLITYPEVGDDEAVKRLRDALALVAASGLTGVHAMSVGDGAVAIYEELDRAGELPVRIWAYVSPGTRAAERLLAEGPWRGDRFAVVGIKASELQALATACLAADAQLAVHAIGDLAVTQVLDGFEAARAAHPDSQALLRAEHAQIVRPADRPRFAELRAVAGMQPTHATSDMPWAEERRGAERIGWAYTWRSLKESGAMLAFGSDFPVEGVSPALGLWAAMTRADAQGRPEGGDPG